MDITVWLNSQTKIFLGGDPGKGQVPLVTVQAQNPQVLISQKNNTIVIVESQTAPGKKAGAEDK